MSVWTDNAETFATRQPEAIDLERRDGVSRTLALIVNGQPGRGLYELVRSVQRQARIAGLGTPDLQPTCPCGGRCPNGKAVSS